MSRQRPVPSGAAELARARALLTGGPAQDAYASFRLARDLLSDDAGLVVAATRGAALAAWAAGDHAACLAELATAAGAPAPDTADDVVALVTDYLTGLRALLELRITDALGPLRRVVAQGSGDERPEALHHAAVAALALGDVGTACQVGARALAAARAHAAAGLRAAAGPGRRNTAAHHHAVLALAASVDGAAAEVAEHAAEALKAARRHGLEQTRTLAEWALARADLGQGRAEDAVARFGALVSPGPGGGHFALRPLLTPGFVEAAVLAGRAEAARPVLGELEIWAKLDLDDAAAARLTRCRALMAAHDGDAESAGHLWARALELHGDGCDSFERATTQFLYGRWLRRRRRPSQARRQLREALQAFERTGAAAWAGQAADELRAAGESAGAAASGIPPVATVAPSSSLPVTAGDTRDGTPLDRLTPHQRRIARYVAEGATNREVACRLSLSVRTVDHHLRNIFAALGVRSRVELTRIVTG
ncbi:hypothetical protein GCM10009751_12660 [Myceligenerans crystallogenes]|uniref:HTH luxR-type domain-containing protein n=1 Tax=Myceligenerans crystallogenes TaxID=316335 RepID=A0ABN2N7Y2_9MICO